MIDKLALYRIGSDAEWVFAIPDDDGWDQDLQPACKVFQIDRADGLTSFIGVDGHATTAELRPPPTHNVGLHLYHIAYGLQRAREFAHKRQPHVQLYASPNALGEPLGGHLHVSFVFRDPQFHKVFNEGSLIAFGNRPWALNPNRPTGSLVAREYLDIILSDPAHQEFTLDAFRGLLEFLLWPWECGIQPWSSRKLRHHVYGEGEIFRPGGSERPPTLPETWSYAHVEYRTPSTWLKHPMLAYSYLGLMKLALLNWRILWVHRNEPRINFSRRSVAEERFKARWNALKRQLRFTPDLQNLDETLSALWQTRTTRLDPRQPIAYDAWDRLL